MNTIEFTNENIISAMATTTSSRRIKEQMIKTRFIFECLPLNTTVTSEAIQKELKKKLNELESAETDYKNFIERSCCRIAMHPLTISRICNSLEVIGIVKISKRKLDTPQPIVINKYDYKTGKVEKKIVGQYDTINEYTRIA